ncbi:MAG: hypothetical protein LUC88_04715, partial [Prevotella sp.]|nr:hypothetical protein [Prevotella sp.]
MPASLIISQTAQTYRAAQPILICYVYKLCLDQLSSLQQIKHLRILRSRSSVATNAVRSSNQLAMSIRAVNLDCIQSTHDTRSGIIRNVVISEASTIFHSYIIRRHNSQNIGGCPSLTSATRRLGHTPAMRIVCSSITNNVTV